jgi:hypothetical protein
MHAKVVICEMDRHDGLAVFLKPSGGDAHRSRFRRKNGGKILPHRFIQALKKRLSIGLADEAP